MATIQEYDKEILVEIPESEMLNDTHAKNIILALGIFSNTKTIFRGEPENASSGISIYIFAFDSNIPLHIIKRSLKRLDVCLK